MLRNILFSFAFVTTAAHAITMHDATEIAHKFLLQPSASKVDAAVYIGTATAITTGLFLKWHGPIPCRDEKGCHVEKIPLLPLVENALISFILLDQTMSLPRALATHLGVPLTSMVLLWVTNREKFTRFLPAFIPPMCGLVGLAVKNGITALIKK